MLGVPVQLISPINRTMANAPASLLALRCRTVHMPNMASKSARKDHVHNGRYGPNRNLNRGCSAAGFRSVTIVMVEVIEPFAGGVTVPGEATMDASPGVPAKVNPTAELNAFSEVTVATTLIVSPALIVAEAGETATVNAVTGAVPVPVSGTSCGELGSLSATLRFAVSAACVVGVNVTLIVQFAPAVNVAGEVPQVFVWLKSPAFAPVKERLMPVSEVVPPSVNVTTCAKLAVFSD